MIKMTDDKTQCFETHRRMLEGIAYRMLGTLGEAQDVVQETYLKWHDADTKNIVSPKAWLITVCTRIALNQLKSARKRRETYTGEWLPEPVAESFANDAAAQIEINESISIALLAALEKLSPAERAVFLLHDIFEIAFDEIAAILEMNNAQCRQLAVRARQHLKAERPRFQASPVAHRRLLDGFVSAIYKCQVDEFAALLCSDVEVHSDGGGKVSALPHVLRGRAEAASFFARVFGQYHQQGTAIHTVIQVFNGAPGLLLYENQTLSTALTIEASNDHIVSIYAVRNPDKLMALPQAPNIALR